MLNELHNVILGDMMLDAETLEQVNALPAEEKLLLVRSAMYSDDHLFKILFRIALIVDPDNTETSLNWLKSRLPLASSANPA